MRDKKLGGMGFQQISDVDFYIDIDRLKAGVKVLEIVVKWFSEDPIELPKHRIVIDSLIEKAKIFLEGK